MVSVFVVNNDDRHPSISVGNCRDYPIEKLPARRVEAPFVTLGFVVLWLQMFKKLLASGWLRILHHIFKILHLLGPFLGGLSKDQGLMLSKQIRKPSSDFRTGRPQN